MINNDGKNIFDFLLFIIFLLFIFLIVDRAAPQDNSSQQQSQNNNYNGNFEEQKELDPEKKYVIIVVGGVSYVREMPESKEEMEKLIYFLANLVTNLDNYYLVKIDEIKIYTEKLIPEITDLVNKQKNVMITIKQIEDDVDKVVKKLGIYPKVLAYYPIGFGAGFGLIYTFPNSNNSIMVDLSASFLNQFGFTFTFTFGYVLWLW